MYCIHHLDQLIGIIHAYAFQQFKFDVLLRYVKLLKHFHIFLHERLILKACLGKVKADGNHLHPLLYALLYHFAYQLKHHLIYITDVAVFIQHRQKQ